MDCTGATKKGENQDSVNEGRKANSSNRVIGERIFLFFLWCNQTHFPVTKIWLTRATRTMGFLLDHNCLFLCEFVKCTGFGSDHSRLVLICFLLVPIGPCIHQARQLRLSGHVNWIIACWPSLLFQKKKACSLSRNVYVHANLCIHQSINTRVLDKARLPVLMRQHDKVSGSKRKLEFFPACCLPQSDQDMNHRTPYKMIKPPPPANEHNKYSSN